MTNPRSDVPKSGGRTGTTPQTTGYVRGDESLTPERRARLVYEAFNERDIEMALDQNRDDVEIADQATGQRFAGREGARRFMQQWLDAFPDAKCLVTNVVAAGDVVAVEYRGQGTNTGPLATPQGPIPPTGKRAEVAMCDVLEFSSGRIARQRTYYDVGSLLRQLGVQG
jgi:steroid delta-isomerase-like uncharacterized protein